MFQSSMCRKFLVKFQDKETVDLAGDIEGNYIFPAFIYSSLELNM